MKKGTIIQNLWAGNETYFIYMGFPIHVGRNEARKTGGYQIVKVDGKWRFDRASYYTNHLKDAEHYPVVGHVDFNQMVVDGILQALGRADHAQE